MVMPKISAIFQVRMGSTRLPGKALIEIEGKPLLQHVVERVQRSKYIDDIVLATTTNNEDISIKEFARNHNLHCFTGSEEDVLDRFYKSAKAYQSDIIVRITPDDPFKDPEIIDRGIELLLNEKRKLDYVTNTLPPSFPIGLDIEVFFFKTLEKAWGEACLPSEREHVTPYIWKHPEIFRIKNFSYDNDISYLRWTLDNERDLLFTREIYSRIYHKNHEFLMNDVLRLLDVEPVLSKINEGEEKFSGYLKSLENDKQSIRENI